MSVAVRLARHAMAARSINSDMRARGFVYLWLLIVVAVLGVTLALGAEWIRTQRTREAEAQLLFVGHQFRLAIERYYEATPGAHKVYPTSIDDLLRDPRFPGIRRHLRKRYHDPITGQPEWGEVRVGPHLVGVYSLSERQPFKVGRFEPADASFEGKAHYSDWKFTYPADLLVRPATPTSPVAAPSPQSAAP